MSDHDLVLLDADGDAAVTVTIDPLSTEDVPDVLSDRARELLEEEFGEGRVVDLR